MICPDCGKEFNFYSDRSDFNSFVEDPTYCYDDIGEKVCYDCARIRFDALFANAEDYDEYSDIYK